MFLASPLMYCHWLRALVSIIAHFLGTTMLILLYIRRGQAASSSSSELYVKSSSFCESLCHRRHVQIPLTCLLLPFISPRSYCTAHPPHPPFFCCPSMRNLVCRVNRGPENNKHKKKGKFPPRRPLTSLPSLPFQCTHYLLSFICSLSALALNLIIFLVNKPVSGRNYTQLGVRSFSVKGAWILLSKMFSISAFVRHF